MMARNYGLLACGMLALALAPLNASAESLRCGTDLVTPGDSLSDLREACGKPARTARLVNDDGETIGAVYYYQQPGRAERRIEIRSGRVSLIERL